MRILVTGAAGYLGSALAKALAGHDVLATDQSAPAPVIGNLAYPQFARSLITRDIEAVFHLASLVSGGAEQSFELGTKVNLDATRDLLHLERISADRLGPRRTLLLNGISASAQEMWDGAPKSTFSERAARLGFPQSKDVQEIVREYEEAALAHHG